MLEKIDKRAKAKYLVRSHSFGKQVKEYRVAKNYKQRDLAKKVGIEVCTLSKIEKGNYSINPQLAWRLSQALDLDEDQHFAFVHLHLADYEESFEQGVDDCRVKALTTENNA